MADRHQSQTGVMLSMDSIDTLTLTQMGTMITLDVGNDDGVAIAMFDLTDLDDIETLLAFGRQWVEIMSEGVEAALEALDE